MLEAYLHPCLWGGTGLQATESPRIRFASRRLDVTCEITANHSVIAKAMHKRRKGEGQGATHGSDSFACFPPSTILETWMVG